MRKGIITRKRRISVVTVKMGDLELYRIGYWFYLQIESS